MSRVTRARVVVGAVALLAPVLLAGCTASGSDATAANFLLTPERLGWNVGETARFTLTLQPAMLAKSPAYTVDPDFAIAEVAFKQRGFGFGGDYRTKNSGDVNLRLWVDGERVSEAPLGPGNESVVITLSLPEKLRDAEYVLELHLFKVGWVQSDTFRANVP